MKTTAQKPVKAPRKPTKARLVAPPAQEDPKDVVLRLDPLTLATMEKLHALVRASSSELLVQQSLRRSYLATIDPKGQLGAHDRKIQELLDEKAQAEREYLDIAGQTGLALGVDLREYAYDDKTGVLRRIDAPVAGDT